MTDVTVYRVQDADGLQAAFSVRRQVFVLEQNVPERLELDDLDQDPHTVHVLARDCQARALGAARMRSYTPTGTAKIERVAVLASHRGTGLGRALMEFLEQAADTAGYQDIVLHAQIGAQKFYERIGYTAFGDRFLDAGIEHIAMRKAMAPPAK